MSVIQLEGSIDPRDLKFLESAAEAGLAVTESGRLAQKLARMPSIRDFAAKMENDHAQLNKALNNLASHKGITLPASPSPLQRAQVEILSQPGKNFEQDYLDRMGIALHEAAIRLFEDAAGNSPDNDIRAFAQAHLSELKAHLVLAQVLRESI